MALTTSDSYGDTDNSDSMGNGSIGTNSNNHLNIRMVTLNKANVNHNGSLGFSIRGGREHSIGVFISNTEPKSEAERSGLRVGDQIIRINGFPIEDATHAEVLHLIQSQNVITLKVRSVGMIPTKEKDNKGVTWKLVDDKHNIKGMGNNQNDKYSIAQVTIDVPAHGRLGCGICKGPVWKPGIFVQFTKDNCIAKDSGLKRGDQILECNGVKFTSDVSFENAVSVMKSSNFLELIIHKGAGMELFPGGSSGYNSSTSSLNGELPPDEPTLLQFKRLSVVKEESLINGVTNSSETINQIEPIKTPHNSLSSAISEEIKRRSERISSSKEPHIMKVDNNKKIPPDNDMHQKLQTLMKEVKEAHTKMFPKNQSEEETNGVNPLSINNNNIRSESPPLCPTPDYDTMSIISNKMKNGTELVEMNSIKSFNTNKSMPKPPPTYFPPPTGFQDESDRGNTHLQSSRPNSNVQLQHNPTIVTIREYPNNTSNVPSKLKFLQNNNNTPRQQCVRFGDELQQSVAAQASLQNEKEMLSSPSKKNSNVVTISIQQHPNQNSFYLHSAKKGPAPQPPAKNKVTFNF